MEHATLSVLILIFCFSAFILLYIHRAKRGAKIFLRRIGGLEVIDDAIGRATELDRPIMFNPGIQGLHIDLFCSLAVMGHVVRRAAKLSMPVHVPIYDPLAYAMAEEYWKDGYAAMNQEGLFAAEECVRFMSNYQPAYGSGIAAWIKREKIGANMMFGQYGYEAMFIAEAAQQSGSIQIACTPSFFQVPFFIIACDYTVFGEEFYAAGAYFSKDPVLTGSLVGQDWSKLVIFILVIIGILCITIFGHDWISLLLTW